MLKSFIRNKIDPLFIGYILSGIFSIPVIFYALYITFMTDGLSRFVDAAQFVAGWLTPLALCWFVATVLLQRKELEAQREELKATRHEHRENRIASERYAEAMDTSSKLQQKSLILDLIRESNHIYLYDAAAIRTFIEYTHHDDSGNVVSLKTIDIYDQYLPYPAKLYREVMSQLHSWPDQGAKNLNKIRKYNELIVESVDRSIFRRDKLLEKAQACDMETAASDVLVHSPLGKYLSELAAWRLKRAQTNKC